MIIYSSIVVLANLLIIIFSIIILTQINPFFEKVNGLGCAFMIFFDHIVYGLSPLYPLESQYWLGFIGIIEKFQISQERYNNLNYDEIEEAFNDIKNIYSANTNSECLNPFTDIEEDKEIYTNYVESVFKNLDYDEIIKLIEKAKDVVMKTSRKIENKLYNAIIK